MRIGSLGVLLAVVAATAACSSSASKGASSTPSTAPGAPTTIAGAYTRPRCHPSAAAPVLATAVVGSASDHDLTSFDGTRIRFHWFPTRANAGKAAPTVLKGPGWGQAGDTDASGSGYGLFGDMSIRALNDAGYNVLTWDPRGFGKSTGTVEVDSAEFEGRDVQRLVDWVATQPGVQLDGANDPRLGMVGASYGGGIQLVAAAIDCRVDAIVPQIAWHSLQTSLFDAETVKQGWADLLYAAAAGRPLDAHITRAHVDGDLTGVVGAADRQWFVDRGPADLVSEITAPTLFEQGTIDTLFPLDEAGANYEIMKAKGVPVAMLWMCSGHGVCLTNPGDQKLPGTAAIAWLDRYVKNDTGVDVGPRFRYVDQNGVEHTAAEYPPAPGTPVAASGNGTLTFTAAGGSGPARPSGQVGALGSVALPITAARAAHAVNVAIPVAAATNVVGAPKITLQYSGTSPAGARPTRVFAQIVDDATGIVLGNQTTPIAVVLDGKPHTASVSLETVAFSANKAATLTLQLVATTVAYAPPRLGGTITFDAIHVELPTTTAVTPAG